MQVSSSLSNITYSELGLLQLAELVVSYADKAALFEIHGNRKVFRLQDGRYLLLAEYLQHLKDRELNANLNNSRAVALAERAYDLTLEKFINLPDQPGIQGSDCRHYYRAFIKAANRRLKNEPPSSKLKLEAMCGQLLKNLVARHFSFARREARREIDPFWSRYQWQVDNHSFTLRMPVALTGDQRREWLEANVPDKIFEHPQANQQIQKLIDKNLVKEHFVALEALEFSAADDASVKSDLDFQYWGIFLAKYVAQEKSKDIESQTSAIQKLGPKKLEKMVRQIFEELAANKYEQKKVAEQFGLSTATLSRFAGSQWHSKRRKRKAKGNFVPDLWRNTAQAISKIPIFRYVAQEAGMLGPIKKISSNSHE